mgnify:CR=1 FL=1
MKKIAFLFLVALCFITAPVFADSGSWIYGETSGGTSVWGHGEGYVDSYVSGEAGTYSWSGGTYVGLDAGIYGEVSANHGAAITSGGAGGYASAFESRWGGVEASAGSGSLSFVASHGNASGYMITGASAYANAWNGWGR